MNSPLQANLTIHAHNQRPDPISPRIFGNFLEQLGYAVDGGVLAFALANPTFERNVNLDAGQVDHLLQTGKILTDFYLKGGDPAVFPENWSPAMNASGFGVSALDDETRRSVPFPWAALGAPGRVSPSVGRIGGAVRLQGGAREDGSIPSNLIPLDDGPVGIRQGIFLPFQRCLAYTGHVWLRIATLDAQAAGAVEIGLRRRLRGPAAGQPAGECLCRCAKPVQGGEWQKLDFRLELKPGQVNPSEPVDFFIRWLPDQPSDLLVDRAILLPEDAIHGLYDPDVVRLVKEWQVPLLRWPGGNFASYYHWQDGVGPFDRRPTRPNYAWGGLDCNFFGALEFVLFCRLVGAEPHLTVNSGTGTPEEAAAWVEFCNGGRDTPMGEKRAQAGDPEPYGVAIWEVGNETYGFWQGGYHGSDENALRFVEFAAAMRRVDPSITLIATGNQFDIAQPRPALDHTTADRLWNKKVIQAGAAEMDYLSLHCLPANDLFLEKLTPEQAYYSLVAQPDSWERVFLPEIRQLLEAPEVAAARKGKPVGVAITEWGVLGSRSVPHPIVENYGEVVYAGVFLNMCMRSHPLVGIANATGLLHGGCIRKAAGQVFYDPQYTVVQQYTRLANSLVLESDVSSPTFDVETAPDLGLPLKDVPYLDVVACELAPSKQIVVCAVNRHLTQNMELNIALDGEGRGAPISWVYLAYPHVTARAKLGDTDRFRLESGALVEQTGSVQALLPPCSVSWITLETAA